MDMQYENYFANTCRCSEDLLNYGENQDVADWHQSSLTLNLVACCVLHRVFIYISSARDVVMMRLKGEEWSACAEQQLCLMAGRQASHRIRRVRNAVVSAITGNRWMFCRTWLAKRLYSESIASALYDSISVSCVW